MVAEAILGRVFFQNARGRSYCFSVSAFRVLLLENLYRHTWFSIISTRTFSSSVSPSSRQERSRFQSSENMVGTEQLRKERSRKTVISVRSILFKILVDTGTWTPQVIPSKVFLPFATNIWVCSQVYMQWNLYQTRCLIKNLKSYNIFEFLMKITQKI